MFETIDEIIRVSYEAVSYDAGGHPDWDAEVAMFAPGARLVRINDTGIYEFTLDTYRSDFERMIASGDMTSFWEGEIWRDEHVFQDMANVLSAYETRRTKGGALINRGINSFQLFQRGGRWWISSLIWRREGEHFKLPDGMRSE